MGDSIHLIHSDNFAKIVYNFIMSFRSPFSWGLFNCLERVKWLGSVQITIMPSPISIYVTVTQWIWLKEAALIIQSQSTSPSINGCTSVNIGLNHSHVSINHNDYHGDEFKWNKSWDKYYWKHMCDVKYVEQLQSSYQHTCRTGVSLDARL